jgi:hypothetical protein
MVKNTKKKLGSQIFEKGTTVKLSLNENLLQSMRYLLAYIIVNLHYNLN